MAKTDIDKIVDSKALQGWLEALPDAQQKLVGVILAHRLAMRVLPLVVSPADHKNGRFAQLLKPAFRSCTYSRIPSAWPKAMSVVPANDRSSMPRLTQGESMALTYNLRAASDAANAEAQIVWANADAAGRIAITNASAARSAASASASAASFTSPNLKATNINVSSTVSAAAEYAAAADTDSWLNLRHDIQLIEDGISNEELLRKPLWPEPPEWWSDAWSEMQNNLLSTENVKDRWDIWAAWYWNVANGLPAFEHLASKLPNIERRIALGDSRKDFWNREAGEINREIAKWVGEAQEPEIDDTLSDDDFQSRPASIETKVHDGKVVLAHLDPLTDLNKNTAEAAAADLAKGLRDLASQAEAAQADPRIIAFLRTAADAIEKAAHDQAKLFESGRNQKALSNYSDTVTNEWNPLLAAQYLGLVMQFAQVLNHFEAWREFVAAAVMAAEPIEPLELADELENIHTALAEEKSVFAENVLPTFQRFIASFRQAVRRLAKEESSIPVLTQTLEAMQIDLGVSASNIVLSYLQWGFQHYGGLAIQGGGVVLDNIAIGAGGLAAAAVIGAVADKLRKYLPEIYDPIVKFIKVLRRLKKETEPD